MDPIQLDQSQSGSGQESQGQPANNDTSEYSITELLADMATESGNLSGEKGEKRGAQETAQSDKGVEPGAEPRKADKPADPPTHTTEGQSETAPAQVQPTGEETLSAEERYRREAQSEKDKRFAAEQEREKLQEQLATRQRADSEAQIDALHIQNTQPARELCNSLLEQYNAAMADEDGNLAQRLYVQWNQAFNTLSRLDGQHAYTKQQQQQSRANEQRQQHLKVLDRELKADFDTSVDELKKLKADLNPFDPFSLQKAIALLHKDRVKSAETKSKTEAEQVLDTARKKWGHSDPGGQPDRGGSSNGSGRSDSFSVGSGSANDAIAGVLEDIGVYKQPARR